MSYRRLYQRKDNNTSCLLWLFSVMKKVGLMALMCLFYSIWRIHTFHFLIKWYSHCNLSSSGKCSSNTIYWIRFSKTIIFVVILCNSITSNAKHSSVTVKWKLFKKAINSTWSTIIIINSQHENWVHGNRNSRDELYREYFRWKGPVSKF